ncbi:UDP-galactose transporter [Pseudohyphozyma bogoriensis]|nr:UDP-galactose transporter [Pseudohyphozyma bogoriensis]
MAPLSKTAILSLVALTLHFSILSIVLHVSLRPAAVKFHASSCVVLTELFKIATAAFLVFWTRELRPAILEIKRERHTKLGELDAAGEPMWLTESGEQEDQAGDLSLSSEGSKRRDSYELSIPSSRNSEDVSDTSATRSSAEFLRTSVEHRRGASLRVNVTAAQAHAHSPPHFPSLALIPPTPALPPSPFKPPDVGALFPTRVPFERNVNHSGLADMWDKDSWTALKNVVVKGMWKLSIPSALFVFQANAQYVASANLSVPVFQLAYQLKIPATALCSIMLLRRTLTAQQWVSLFLLTAGVGIVQLQNSQPEGHDSHHSRLPSSLGNQALGLSAVLAACLSSGFASTYLERVLKTPTPPPTTSAPNSIPVQAALPSLWIRNIQLSTFGLAFALPLAMYESGGWAGVDEGWWDSGGWGASLFLSSFFEGFGGMAWLVVFLQVSGGLLGALVMQHADNIAKCFATSISILLSFAFSVLFFDFHMSAGFLFGAFCVLGATYLYAVRSVPWRKVVRPQTPALS